MFIILLSERIVEDYIHLYNHKRVQRKLNSLIPME
ncbi:IS3 family transposase [Halobacillus naozhouensis]